MEVGVVLLEVLCCLCTYDIITNRRTWVGVARLRPRDRSRYVVTESIAGHNCMLVLG
jgi:hypothetical protein